MSGQDLLPELRALAQEAGELAQRSRDKMVREIKPDGSIVTNGDREVESFLRPRLESLLPGSTIWGEEFGYAEEGPNGLWVVDPVDGTSNYAYHSPLWGISIGLIKGREIAAGVVNLPDLGELYASAPGAGVECNGAPLKAIPPAPIRREELVSYGEPILRWGKPIPGKMRVSGAFVIDGCFTIQQRFRGLIGIREKLYDVAPCVLFARELGGEVRYADGSAFEIGDLKVNEKIQKPWIIFPSGTDFVMA